MSYLNRENDYTPTGQVNGAALQRQYTVVCICGSMRFYSEMLREAEALTLRGSIVLMPFAFKEDGDAKMLDDMHRRKIDMASIVVIITGGSGYMGESTQREHEYAELNGKTVIVK